MKSATTVRASSSSAPDSMRWGSGSRASTASHGSVSAEPLEPVASMLEEQVGQRRVVRLAAALARGLEGAVRREEAADRLHVVAEVHDAHRERDRLALRVVGMARSRSSISNVKRSASRTPGPKSSRSTSTSATSHPDEKLYNAHSRIVSWIIRTISSRSSGPRPAVAKATMSRITSAGLPESWTSVWARIAISSPNRVATSWAWPVQPMNRSSATQ